MIRVVIVSPIRAVRIGLREMLKDQSDIMVVGEVVGVEDVHENEAEVMVLSAASFSHFQESFGVLLLTDDATEARRLADLNLRAWGILSASAAGAELAAAIHAVEEGLWVGAPSLVQKLMRVREVGKLSEDESPVETLTARELEVLQRMAEGLANKQIALQLGISEHTVKFHLSSLYAKLNVSSRTEAIKVGVSFGLISL